MFVDLKKMFYNEKPNSLFTTMKGLYGVLGDTFPDLLVTEYLPGKEYTVDCISDIYGDLLTSYVRERKEIRNGVCKSTSYVNNSSDFLETAEIIASKLRIKGAWFFQMKINKNN